MKFRQPLVMSLLTVVAAACGASAESSESVDQTREGADTVEGRPSSVETSVSESELARAGAASGVWQIKRPGGRGKGSGSGSGSATPATDAGKTEPEADAGVPAKNEEAGATKPEEDAGTPAKAVDASSTVDAAPPAPVSPYAGLHASGGTILDHNGKKVLIHGVNRSGSEFACVDGYDFFNGPVDQASITAMKSWGINAVRILLNEDCWLGINGVSSTYSGAAYRTAIQTYVTLLLANGMYPIVDLHWNAPGTTLATGQEPMADADHAPAFWTSVAGTFKSSGNVILELYNEPWPDNDQDTTAAWKCWRDGGSCPSVPYEVAGMQTLVNVVRAAGATNLVLLGGVEYSNALSQWVAYKPSDPLNNLAAAWHVYQGNACSDTSCFDQIAAPVAAAFPIVATEIGDSACDGAYMTMVMDWLDAHGQSYSAWTWNAWGADCGSYSLVTDYEGTPNGAYGLAYQTHLKAL